MFSCDKDTGSNLSFSDQLHLSTIFGRGTLARNDWNCGFQLKIARNDGFISPLITPNKKISYIKRFSRMISICA